VAQDFTVALVGPQQRVAVLLASIDRRMSEAGLSRGSAVYEEDLDGDTNPEVEVPLSDGPVRDVIDKLIFWRAASMEFHRDELTIEIVSSAIARSASPTAFCAPICGHLFGSTSRSSKISISRRPWASPKALLP
jgi:hypothetical protein